MPLISALMGIAACQPALAYTGRLFREKSLGWCMKLPDWSRSPMPTGCTMFPAWQSRLFPNGIVDGRSLTTISHQNQKTCRCTKKNPVMYSTRGLMCWKVFTFVLYIFCYYIIFLHSLHEEFFISTISC